MGDAYLELRLLPEATALLEEAVSRFDSLAMPDDQAWAMAQLVNGVGVLMECTVGERPRVSVTHRKH